MPAHLLDTFTEASATNLEAHTPDIGGAWTKIAGTTTQVGAGTGYLTEVADDQPYYENATVSAGANDPIKCLFRLNDVSRGIASIGLRYAAPGSVVKGYRFDVRPGNWYFVKLDGSGGETILNSGTHTLATATNHTSEVVPTGTSFDCKINGTSVTGSPFADTSYNGTGKNQIMLRQASLDWVVAGTTGTSAPDGSTLGGGGGGSSPVGAASTYYASLIGRN